jgi:hypothetical protein
MRCGSRAAAAWRHQDGVAAFLVFGVNRPIADVHELGLTANCGGRLHSKTISQLSNNQAAQK